MIGTHHPTDRQKDRQNDTRAMAARRDGSDAMITGSGGGSFSTAKRLQPSSSAHP